MVNLNKAKEKVQIGSRSIQEPEINFDYTWNYEDGLQHGELLAYINWGCEYKKSPQGMVQFKEEELFWTDKVKSNENIDKEENNQEG